MRFWPYDGRFYEIEFWRGGNMKKWIGAGLILTATLSRGDTLVVPNRYANVDSPGAGGIFPGTSSAYQEVFDASSFLNVPAGGIAITDFSWRFDNPGQGGGNGGGHNSFFG